MNLKKRKKFLTQQARALILWTGICGILFFHFANCESYSQQNLYSSTPFPKQTPELNISLDTCITHPGSSACEQARKEDEEMRSGWINLTIVGNNPFYVNPVDFGLNISGSCNSANFTQSEVYFTLINQNNQNLKLSNDPGNNCLLGNICNNPSRISCVSGHWSLSFFVNGSTFYDDPTHTGVVVPFDKTVSHRLIVEMIVRGDSTGEVYRNSIAQSTIELVPASQ